MPTRAGPAEGPSDNDGGATSPRTCPRALEWLANAALVVWATALMLVFNGGVSIGYANHCALLPVVRRILDPGYLPDDFGIRLRLYHHRMFAELVAFGARFVGEDGALILLSILGMGLIAAALLHLSRTLRLSTPAFCLAVLLLALRIGTTGKGLEINRFLGTDEIMPPVFAHAFVLLAVSQLLRGNLRAVSFLAGLSFLTHLQIGVAATAALLPFLLVRLRHRPPREAAICAALFAGAALPALWHVAPMLRRGAADATMLLDYIAYRQPHHFAFRAERLLIVGVFLALQILALRWFARRSLPEAAALRVFCIVDAILLAMSAVHFLDYEIVRWGKIALLQTLRLSPLITVLAAVSLVLWIDRLPAGSIRLVPTFDRQVAARISLGLAVLASVACVAKPTLSGEPFVRRYAEERSAWADVCRHARQRTPARSLFLTPPGNEGFTYLSERSTVVEFKLNPDGGMYLDEWYERLRDLAGGSLPNEPRRDKHVLLNDAFARLQPERLAEIGRKYGAEFAVVSSVVSTPFEVLYENDAYRLLRLPTTRSDRDP